MASGPLEGAPLQAECEQRGFVVCPAEGFPERGRPLPGRKRGRGEGAGHDRSRPSYLAQQFVVIFEETASGSHEDSSFCFPCLFNTLARGTPDPGPR